MIVSDEPIICSNMVPTLKEILIPDDNRENTICFICNV